MDQNPSEENPKFSINDLVWGKIKGHPWWPGQIYDPKQASEFAIKKQKNGYFLVGCFGDKTFAWVQESKLKHFEPYFNEMGNHKDLLLEAVNDALSEYSRQIELGLVCKCMKNEILVGLRNKKVENAGVREGTCNVGTITSEFLPSMFLEFILACALSPFDEVDRLELARVVGQLKAFCGLKGNNELCSMCESTVYLTDDDCKVDVGLNVKPIIEGRPLKVNEEMEESEKGGGISDVSKGKRKYGRKASDMSCEVMPDSREKAIKVDSSASNKKRGRTRLIREEANENKGSSSGEKVSKGRYIRKTLDNEKHCAEGSAKLGRRKKVKDCENVSEKRSSESEELTEEEDSGLENCKLKVRKKKKLDGDFESGELERRKRVKHVKEIASPLSAMRAKLGDRIKQVAMKVKASLTGEMLSQLYSLALDPTSCSDSLPGNIKFFTDFKNFISSMHKAGKGRSNKKEGYGGLASFEFSEDDFVQDSYWSDILFDGSPKKEAASKEVDMEDRNVADSVKKTEMVDRSVIISKFVNRPDVETPTELIFGFSEPDDLPSISDLTGKLSAYGPLKEGGTEILSTKKQAKAVFKYRVDAESAYDDVGNHSLFRVTPVSYKLRYSHQPSSTISPKTDCLPQINNVSLEDPGLHGNGAVVDGK